MEIYKNSGGNSGVNAYEILENSMVVEFSNGAIYLYTVESAGRSNIERMKALARSGKGLNSFIITRVKGNYLKKVA